MGRAFHAQPAPPFPLETLNPEEEPRGRRRQILRRGTRHNSVASVCENVKNSAMTHDAIILGGGILGCTTAFFLARRGLRPVVIEPGDIAGGTTSNSFAWANASTKTGDAAYHRLNAAGVAGFNALAGAFGTAALGIDPGGALQVVAPDDAAGLAAMRSDAARLSELGYPCRLIGETELRAAEPMLSFAPGSEALHAQADLIVDAPRFTRFIAGEAVRLGAELRTGTAPGPLIADEDGTVRGVETAAGPLHAAHVILAAGADTPEALASLTGYEGFSTRFPLRRVPGFLLTTPPLEPRPLRHLLYTSTTDEFHMLPTAGGGLRMGSDDVDSFIWEDRSEAAFRKAARALLARAERFLPGISGRIEPEACDLRVGVRPYPEDGRSIAGALPGARGLYVLATHSGITLAPAIGALMAEWIATGNRPDTLAPHGLERFPGFSG